MHHQAAVVVLLAAIVGPETRAQERKERAGPNDLRAARALARQSNRDLLLIFTNSADPASAAWRDQVLGKPVFRENAEKQLVLVDLELPPQWRAPADARATLTLWGRFLTGGVPGVVLADADGRPFAWADAAQGSPEQCLASIVALREKRAVRDAALARAKTAFNPAGKARALAEALDAVMPELLRFYAGEIDEVMLLDTGGLLGFKARFHEVRERAKAATRLAELAARLEVADGPQERAPLAEALHGVVAELAPTGADLQRALLLEALASAGDDVPSLTRCVRCVDQAERVAAMGDLRCAVRSARGCFMRELQLADQRRLRQQAEDADRRAHEAAQTQPKK